MIYYNIRLAFLKKTRFTCCQVVWALGTRSCSSLSCQQRSVDTLECVCETVSECWLTPDDSRRSSWREICTEKKSLIKACSGPGVTATPADHHQPPIWVQRVSRDHLDAESELKEMTLFRDITAVLSWRWGPNSYSSEAFLLFKLRLSNNTLTFSWCTLFQL